MKVKLEYEETGQSSIVEMKTTPRIGERLMTAAGETMEIVQVVHTPTKEEHGAIVVLRKAEDDGFGN